MTNQYLILFSEQDADGVSEAFRTDDTLTLSMSPALRTWGDLDGGSVVMQTLNPSKTLGNADNDADSEDWQNTDDDILAQGYASLERSRLYHRLKLADLGGAASFNAELIKNNV